MTNHPGRRAPVRLPETLPQALAEARLRAGLSPGSAGKLVNAAPRTWEQWETGQRGIPLTTLELWCVVVIADGLLSAEDVFARMWIRPSLGALIDQCRQQNSSSNVYSAN